MEAYFYFSGVSVALCVAAFVWMFTLCCFF